MLRRGKQTSVRASAPLTRVVFRDFFSRFWVFWSVSFQSRFVVFGTNLTLELSIFAFRAYESAPGFKKSADLALMFSVFCILFRVGANPVPAAGTPSV